MTKAPEIISITNVGLAVLQALAKYRYLTVRQMIELGVAKDVGHLRTVLRGFQSAKKQPGAAKAVLKPREIGQLDYGTLVGKKRLDIHYFLTKRGALLLDEECPELAPAHFYTRIKKAANDYLHKVATVDARICLDQWAAQNEQTFSWFLLYFDRSKPDSNGRSHEVTRIPLEHMNIHSDAAFMLCDREGTERLCLFEMANGMDTGRNLKQMQQYALGLDQGAINKHFDYGSKPPRILYVFENRHLMELVQKRALNDPWLKTYQAHFFLKSFDDLSPDTFASEWYELDATKEARKLL